jgi:hypothetical protein
MKKDTVLHKILLPYMSVSVLGPRETAIIDDASIVDLPGIPLRGFTISINIRKLQQ